MRAYANGTPESTWFYTCRVSKFHFKFLGQRLPWFLPQPIGEPDAQGDNRKCWIGVPTGREHRAATYEKIRHTMHLAVPIHHSLLG